MKTQKFTAANGTEIAIEMFPTNESTLQSGELMVNGVRVGFVSVWENESEVHAHYDEHPDYTGRGTSPLAAAVNLSEQVDAPVPNIPLETLATDNHDYTYAVELQPADNGKLVLRILNTPGGWYLDDLKNVTDIIYIDHGQDWYCDNIQAVLTEARNLVEAM